MFRQSSLNLLPFFLTTEVLCVNLTANNRPQTYSHFYKIPCIIYSFMKFTEVIYLNKNYINTFCTLELLLTAKLLAISTWKMTDNKTKCSIQCELKK